MIIFISPSPCLSPAVEGEGHALGEGRKVITLDLRPLDTASWSYVQQQSMNPRLRYTVHLLTCCWEDHVMLLLYLWLSRVSLPPSKTVEDLLCFMATRWHLVSSNILYEPEYSLEWGDGVSTEIPCSASCTYKIVVICLMNQFRVSLTHGVHSFRWCHANTIADLYDQLKQSCKPSCTW